MRQLLKFFVALTLLACAACGGDPASPNNQAVSPTQAALPTNEAGSPIVARVNDQEITLAQLNGMVTQFGQQGDAAYVRSMALQTLIEQTLIRQAATAQSVTISDAELDAALQSNVDQAGGTTAWQTWLTSNGYSEEIFRESLRDTLITLRMRDLLTADLNGDVPQVHARHILLATEQEAMDVLQRLQNGDDFGALAAVYSRDVTTRINGGDLGWFAFDELLEPALSEQVFALQAGEIVGPVQTGLGFHIIQSLERADRPLTEDKRAFIAQARFENWLNRLHSDAAIEQYI